NALMAEPLASILHPFPPALEQFGGLLRRMRISDAALGRGQIRDFLKPSLATSVRSDAWSITHRARSRVAGSCSTRPHASSSAFAISRPAYWRFTSTRWRAVAALRV